MDSRALTLQQIAMPIFAIGGGTAFLYFAGPVLIPLVLAAALTYLLMPVVEFIKKLKAPHSIAVLIVTIVVLLIFALVIYYFVGEASNLAASLPQYQDRIINTVENWNSRLTEVAGSFEKFIKGSENLTIDSEKVQSMGKFLLKGISSVTGFILASVMIFFLVLFMLLDSGMFARKFKKIFGEGRAGETERILEKINKQLKGYIQVKFYVFIGLSVIITIGLLIMDVQYAYIWGPLAGLLNIIPYIGAIAGAIPPIIMAGIQHNSLAPMIYVAIFFLVLQTVEGNLITPRLTTSSVDLNAVTAFVSLMYWGWIWGGIGLILAVPLTAAIKVICDHVDSLRPIGILLGTERIDSDTVDTANET